MSIQDTIKNGLLSAPYLQPVATNTPHDKGPLPNRWGKEAALAYQTIAPYAGNVYEAKVQGLDYEHFDNWTDCLIRCAPVVDSTTGENISEDWQRVMIIDRHIDFIPAGAYMEFNNNLWIVYNPENVSSDIATCVVQRCNTTYNHLDWYGNIIRTPMAVAKGKVLASSPYYMEYSSVMDGYGHAVLQYNEETTDIHDNTRFLLGNSAYAFYGVVNYAQEFTGDDNSVHIIKTDFRVNEIIPSDDRVNRVANGAGFRFTISLRVKRDGNLGTQVLEPVFQRNGETVVSAEEHPITPVWASSDEVVATVDENGVLTVCGVGDAVITCSLKENPNVKATAEVHSEGDEIFSTTIRIGEDSGDLTWTVYPQSYTGTEMDRTEQGDLTATEPEEGLVADVDIDENGNLVASMDVEPYVEFISVPLTAGVFTSFPVRAAYYENGVATDEVVAITASNAPAEAFTLTHNGDNSATVDVWMPGYTLTLTAVHGTYSATANVVLEGF